MVCDFVIGGFRSILCVLVFQGLLFVIVIILLLLMSAKNTIVKAGFEL